MVMMEIYLINHYETKKIKDQITQKAFFMITISINNDIN